MRRKIQFSRAKTVSLQFLRPESEGFKQKLERVAVAGELASPSTSLSERSLDNLWTKGWMGTKRPVPATLSGYYGKPWRVSRSKNGSESLIAPGNGMTRHKTARALRIHSRVLGIIPIRVSLSIVCGPHHTGAARSCARGAGMARRGGRQSSRSISYSRMLPVRASISYSYSTPSLVNSTS